MEINPIKTKMDYEGALRRVEDLWDAAKGGPASDELDVLVSLIVAYERQNYPVDFPDPIEAIKFRLEQSEKDTRSLIGVIGSRTRVYEVMRRARPLSLNMVRKLHARLGIPADVLIQPIRTEVRKLRQRVLRRRVAVRGARRRK